LVGFVDPESAAYAAGLRTGDEILSINGERVSNWDEINISVALSETPAIALVVRPQGNEDGRELILDAEYGALGVERVKGLPGVAAPAYCMVGRTQPGSSAEAAGLLPGDLMISLDGQMLQSPAHMKMLVQETKGRTVPLLIERNGESMTVMVTPQWEEEAQEARIGVAFNPYHFNKHKLVHPAPMDQVKGHASLIFTTLKALVTPSTAKDAANAIGGPPMIFYYIYAMLKTSFKMALWFTCLLNVNLAIINLMPFPVLDGGHIVFALIEWVARRPVHERVVNAITTACAVLLIGAMLFLSARDINTMWGWREDAREPPATATPAETVPAPPADNGQ
jgi:regulator of sigma E protease